MRRGRKKYQTHKNKAYGVRSMFHENNEKRVLPCSGARMGTLMLAAVAAVAKREAAVAAGVGLDSRMDAVVPLEVAGAGENLPALITRKVPSTALGLELALAWLGRVLDFGSSHQQLEAG